MLLAALMLALGTGQAAAAPKGTAAACAGGVFLLEAPVTLPGNDEPVDTITVRHPLMVEIAGCGEVQGHTRRARRQQWVRARWRCGGAGRVRLRAAVVGDGCNGLAGTLGTRRAKPVVLAATRLPSVAGQWVFSGTETESCRSFSGGCGLPGTSPPVTSYDKVTPVTAIITITQDGQAVSATISPATFAPDEPFTGTFETADSFTLTRHPTTGTSATAFETATVTGLRNGTAAVRALFHADYRPHIQFTQEWDGTMRLEEP